MSPKMNRREVTPERALDRLEQMCARAEHCTSEVYDKLRLWQISPADSARITAHLVSERYIDDARFTRAYVNDKIMFARWGRRKVQQALRVKRIDPDLINEALAEIDNEAYTDNLRLLIEHKIKGAPHLAETYEGRTKIYRSLLSRGYEPDLAARLLREAIGRLND